jgi:hypothetical protein
MSELKSKENNMIEKIEKLRLDGSKLSSSISSMRLGMFTRRISHR